MCACGRWAMKLSIACLALGATLCSLSQGLLLSQLRPQRKRQALPRVRPLAPQSRHQIQRRRQQRRPRRIQPLQLPLLQARRRRPTLRCRRQPIHLRRSVCWQRRAISWQSPRPLWLGMRLRAWWATVFAGEWLAATGSMLPCPLPTAPISLRNFKWELSTKRKCRRKETA